MFSDFSVYANLQELVLSDHIYQDKSHRLFELLSTMEFDHDSGSPNIYLMTRPRGFGLSLVAQAIEKILGREKEVLDKIDDKNIIDSFETQNVVTVDFKKFKASSPKEFANALLDGIQELYWNHHIESQISSYQTPNTYFIRLIKALYKRHNSKISIVIDNYDVPLIIASTMRSSQDKIESACIYLDLLNEIKHAYATTKWCLLTGHIKFTLASEISEGLPLVRDLSNDPRFETLFGFTPKEVFSIFHNEIRRISKNRSIGEIEFLDKLDKCYGGFSFSDNLIKVMCPACINRAILNSGELYPYSSNGDYAFLRQVLKECDDDFKWLFDKDGQDPLFANSIDIDPQGKQVGSLLIQLGFATRDRVLVNEYPGYTTWRYHFTCPNLDMRHTLSINMDGKNFLAGTTVNLMPF